MKNPTQRRWPLWIAVGVVVGLAVLFVRYRDLTFSLLGLNLASPDSAAQLGLRQIAEIPLPGSAGRFDYQSIDADRRRLFIAHLGAGQVTVFDLDRQRVQTTIDGVAGAHGVLVVPDLARVYVSATDAQQVVAIDADTLQIVGRAAGGQYPDGLAYDPDTHLLFVSDEGGGADLVIDPATDQLTKTIELGAGVGNTQFDPVSRQILVAVHAPAQLAVIDPAAAAVIRRIDLPECQAPHGFTLDAPTRRAFVTCEGNAHLLVVDLDSGQVLATAGVGDVPDVVAFDAGLGRLYVAAESGVVAVFDTRESGLQLIGQAFLAPNAHTVAVDPATHRVYFPLENSGGRPALRVYEPLPDR